MTPPGEAIRWSCNSSLDVIARSPAVAGRRSNLAVSTRNFKCQGPLAPGPKIVILSGFQPAKHALSVVEGNLRLRTRRRNRDTEILRRPPCGARLRMTRSWAEDRQVRGRRPRRGVRERKLPPWCAPSMAWRAGRRKLTLSHSKARACPPPPCGHGKPCPYSPIFIHILRIDTYAAGGRAVECGSGSSRHSARQAWLGAREGESSRFRTPRQELAHLRRTLNHTVRPGR